MRIVDKSPRFIAPIQMLMGIYHTKQFVLLFGSFNRYGHCWRILTPVPDPVILPGVVLIFAQIPGLAICPNKYYPGRTPCASLTNWDSAIPIAIRLVRGTLMPCRYSSPRNIPDCRSKAAARSAPYDRTPSSARKRPNRRIANSTNSRARRAILFHMRPPRSATPSATTPQRIWVFIHCVVVNLKFHGDMHWPPLGLHAKLGVARSISSFLLCSGSIGVKSHGEKLDRAALFHL